MIETRRSPENARSFLAKRRAEADARAKDHIQILRASAAMRRHQSVAEALQRIMIHGTRFVFDTVADIFRPQPWAADPNGELLGHLLTVDDAVFDRVAEECLVEVLTLPEAFDRPWADREQRSAWVRAYAESLRWQADLQERADLALRQEDELEKKVWKVQRRDDDNSGPDRL